MLGDIINSQQFDFSCDSEAVAKRVQFEIEMHLAPRINEILDSIFKSLGHKNQYVEIDRIEIDLGNLSFSELGAMSVADRIRSALTEQLAGLVREATGKMSGITGEPIPKSRVMSLVENELEIIRAFLRVGNVPWWVDKSHPPDIDYLLKKLAAMHPATLKALVDKHVDHPAAIARLLTQLKPSTMLRLAELVPAISFPSVKEQLLHMEGHPGVLGFSPAHFKALKKLFKNASSQSRGRAGQGLVPQLVQLLLTNYFDLPKTVRLNLRSLFTGMVDEPFLDLLFDHIVSGHPITRNRRQQLVMELTRLPVLQTEFLLFVFNQIAPTPVVVPTGGEAPALHGGSAASMQPPVHFGRGGELLSVRAGDRKRPTATPPAPGVAYPPSLSPPGEPPTSHSSSAQQAVNVLPGSIQEAATNLQLDPGDSRPLAGAADTPAGLVESQARMDDAYRIEKKAPGTFKQAILAAPDRTGTTAFQRLDSDAPGNKMPAETAAAAPYAETPSQRKLIRLIMQRLRSSSPAVLSYLRQLDAFSLERLGQVFREQAQSEVQRRKTIRELLEHPAMKESYVLRAFAGILQLPVSQLNAKTKQNKTPGATVFPPSLQPNIRAVQKAFFGFIAALPVRELVLLKDVFKKGTYTSSTEKVLLKKALLQLPASNIVLLKFLTELPPSAMEQLKLAEQHALLRAKGAVHPAAETETVSEQGIYIQNAGVCLLAVYLPGLFRQLGYLENGTFRNIGFAMRAIYLLQYLATGRNAHPEYLLQFNKLLCGFAVDDYITGRVRLSKKETTEATTLLESVIKNWRALKNTSVNGLQQSFLQRKGQLVESETKWTLKVERKGYDVLLNTLPWGYSLIKLPWMKKFIQVEWQ